MRSKSANLLRLLKLSALCGASALLIIACIDQGGKVEVIKKPKAQGAAAQALPPAGHQPMATTPTPFLPNCPPTPTPISAWELDDDHDHDHDHAEVTPAAMNPAPLQPQTVPGAAAAPGLPANCWPQATPANPWQTPGLMVPSTLPAFATPTPFIDEHDHDH